MTLACVVQIDAWDPIAGSAVTLFAGSHDDVAVCHLDAKTWWPAIAKLPTLRYDLFDGGFGGSITPPSSSLVLRTEPWPDLARYSLADARLRLWTGELGAAWSGYTLRFDGRVTAQPQIEDGAAAISFAVDDRWLDQALLATYTGTTGVEGPAALKGQAKPLALGAPRYVPGVLIDPVNSVFQVSAYGAVNAFEAALERLARFGPAAADHADYAALIAANVPAGRWATCRAAGLARFGAPPMGQITFLLQGDVAGTDDWARKPGQLIRRLATLSGGGGKVDNASLNALDVARPFNLSLYVDQQTTARDLIQRIAASVNAVAGVSWTGQLFVAPVAIGAPTVTLAADGSALPPAASVKQLEIDPPFKKITVGAERTWTVHQLADIAFTATLVDVGDYQAGTVYREGNVVTLSDGSRYVFDGPTPAAAGAPADDALNWKTLSPALDPVYPDKTPISALQPAQAGADKTIDVLENRSFALLTAADRIGTETRKRFDPIFWTTNFPNTMMAGVRATAPDALQLDAVFLEKGHLAGLIWESADTHDHPTTAYDTDRDYRGCVLQFRLQLSAEVQSLSDDNGPVLAVEGRTSGGAARVWYVRLANAALAGGTARDATIRLDFDNLPGGFFGTDGVYAGDVDRMFISFVPVAFAEGASAKLPAATEAAIAVTALTVTGANADLVCGTGPGGVHDVRMTSGYDDTYSVTPARIIRNLDLLGYKGEFNQYVGMSHYFRWEWSAAEGRYLAQDVALPLNTPCRVWHEDLAARLKASGRELIVSLSYELLNSFMPAAWRQLDSTGAPALTGWEPPSSLCSPCNAAAMGYLAKVARQFCGIAAAAGLTVRFQVGEPWYWIDYRTLRPYLYDAATTAAWTAEKGSAPPIIASMAAAMSAAQLAYLDWLGGKLAGSILDLIAAVRADHPNVVGYALLYLPQLLNGATPEAHRVNMPAGLAYPALDVLQLEDYDFVVANRLDLSATARASAEKKLGYPRSRQEYFAGFALYKDASDAIWRASTNAMADAYDYGVQPVYIWAYTQVLRDGYVPRLKFAPALSVRDLRDVGKAAPANGQVLAWNAASRSWLPTTVAPAVASWGGITGALTDQLDLAGALAAKLNVGQKGAADGLATLDGGGKVPTSQLPALAITATFVVNSQAAQLALTTQEGDVAVRTDLNKSFIRNAGSAGTLADWQELLTPTGNVSSVAGKTGAVSLAKADVGLENVDNTSDTNKPVSIAQATALAAKASLSGAAFTGNVSATSLAANGYSSAGLAGAWAHMGIHAGQGIIQSYDFTAQAYIQTQVHALSITYNCPLIAGAGIKAAALPTYATDVAAGTGGLSTGNIYKTATGELRVKL